MNGKYGAYGLSTGSSISLTAVAAATATAANPFTMIPDSPLSQRYAEAGAAKSESFQALALVVGAARRWSHYSFLLTIGFWILLLFALLFRFRLVPRWLAALGMVGAMMQIGGVSVRGLLGLPPETRLAMPLAPIYVLLAVWLMVRGFDKPPLHSVRCECRDTSAYTSGR